MRLLTLYPTQMASWKHNGRASDIFSLGCVLLEIVVLHDQGTLQHMRLNRSADPAFHANLGRVDAWFEGPSPKSTSSRHSYLISEIKSMLAHDPEVRPTAQELLIRVTGYDISQMITSKHSVFGDCCRGHFVSPQQRERDRYMYTSAITDLRSDLQRAHEDLAEKDNQIIRVVEEHTATSAQLLDEQVSCSIGGAEQH
jgi:serine/threonine protein kinase